MLVGWSPFSVPDTAGLDRLAVQARIMASIAHAEARVPLPPAQRMYATNGALKKAAEACCCGAEPRHSHLTGAVPLRG